MLLLQNKLRKFYVNMRNILFAAIVAVAICGCGHNHKNENAHSHEHPVLDATFYSNSVELFVQYDELKAGHKASVTAYVTSLPSFKPYEGGAIKVALNTGEGSEVTYAVTEALCPALSSSYCTKSSTELL